MDANRQAVHPNIVKMIPMVEGIVQLLHPYAEGAVHDLKQGRIIALYNNISKRKVGDSSVVTELGVPVEHFPDFFEPYYKTNWDGRKLKCTSVTVRDETGAPVGLICINFDTTVFDNMNAELGKFLRIGGKDALNPVELFTENWQRQVSAYIDDYTVKSSTSLNSLSKEQKAELVGQLYDHGLFNYHEAAMYIARTLNVSRATVYNYLKEGKGNA